MRPTPLLPRLLLAALSGLAFVAPPSQARAASPLFVEATAKLGTPQPCGGKGCYSNYVLIADLDADGHLDLAFANGGGYYLLGNAEPLALYRGDGKGGFSEVNASVLGGFQGRLRQVAAGDIDGDGDLDLIAPDSWAQQADAVFLNQGPGLPMLEEGVLRLGTSSRAAGARLGDLDGDGDLDLAVTDWGDKPPKSPGTARIYLNDGKGYFTEKALAVGQSTQAIGTGPIDLDLLDIDGDFDLDLLLASRQGESLLFRNQGDATFADANADLADQPGPYVYGPDACDVDGDGDLDLWLDNGGAGLKEQLLLNDGQGKFQDVSAERIQGNQGADDNEVQCLDVDDDGDLDAVVASLSGNERILLNDGKGFFTGVQGVFPKVADSTLGLDLADLDGDGRLDAVTAQGEGGSFLNRLYLGLPEQATDSHAPVIRAVQAVTGAVVPGDLAIRFAVSDRMTTDLGPRLQAAWLAVAGDKTKRAARFVGGDLFYATLPVSAGAQLSVRACARDPGGLETCSAPFAVQGQGVPAPDAGSADSQQIDAGETVDAVQDATGGPADTASDAGTPAKGKTKPADEGCQAGRRPLVGWTWSLWLGLGAVGWLRQRVRRALR